MSQPNILVVDDEPKYLFFLKLNLESYGYTVATAANGAEALTQMAESEPDAVLLDIAMPPPTAMKSAAAYGNFPPCR